MSIVKDIKGTFVAPKKKYYLGWIKHGTPYMHPRKFLPTIISIKKDKPKYNRNPNFNLFGYNISYGYPIWVHRNDLGWKDKFNSPRFEWSPAFYIYFFKFQFCIWWNSPDLNSHSNDSYYEMILWCLKYCDGDIKKAEQTWGWSDRDGKSTWNKKYVIDNLQAKRDRILNKLIK